MFPKFQSPLDDPVLSGVMGPIPSPPPPRLAELALSRRLLLFVAVTEGEYVSCFMLPFVLVVDDKGGYLDVAVVGAFPVEDRRIVEGCCCSYAPVPYFDVALGRGAASAAFNFPNAFRLLLILLIHSGLSAKGGPSPCLPACFSRCSSLLNRFFAEGLNESAGKSKVGSSCARRLITCSSSLRSARRRGSRLVSGRVPRRNAAEIER